MNTWVALLRGVNVTGARKLLMKDLVALLERDGFGAVRTYIQSGNVVFESASGSARALEARIARLILAHAGFTPRVMVLSSAELGGAVRGNPFPQAELDHKALHLFFLSAPPVRPDLESLTRLRSGGEAFALHERVFYLHTPRGFPQSALHDKVERYLGVHATARNWRTANQLLAMVTQARPATSARPAAAVRAAGTARAVRGSPRRGLSGQRRQKAC
ncbi:MAG: DUF1697 domain-containing protein [Gammaproteobacteria bacterium]|nr:DUF1697 domain-containing protein [Gammaproteobacteria bacterium]